MKTLAAILLLLSAAAVQAQEPRASDHCIVKEQPDGSLLLVCYDVLHGGYSIFTLPLGG
jgi:hypothetical protein